MNSLLQAKKRAAGFSLMEMLIVVLILFVLLGVAFGMINRSQKIFTVENQKVDFTQQQREYIDQFTRDMHQAGYPNAVMQGGVAAPFNGIQAGFTNTSVTMIGDLGDGAGAHNYTYDYRADCACMERGIDGTLVTAVENVAPPNPPQEIFTFYDNKGAVVTNNAAAIHSISITFTVQGGNDVNGRTRIQSTMTGMARLPNND